ncbi:dynamin family protein, partial [Geminocystis sp. GBBB08]|uniref:dynamin family protein n=1 Tax=Geminocystis sp. GBBB08 TaxID=2604140 RepID=UPI0027E27CB8
MEKPQSPDIQAQLNQARENLQRLGNAVSELVNLSPDVFGDEAIKTRLQDFQQAYEEATQRLANPTFRIATIGTTSSGKSTIVNALMGRRIAPIEAGEMSGGVLTLTHSHERKLVIEATEESVWETGEWTNISDNDLYSRIQMAMHSYHEARKKKEYIAPQITAHIPLLPACDASLSGLPEGINVEFLDLPGLKSVQDKTNLAILQPLVGRAFSLVALDYMRVDEQHRQKLLTELKKVVEYLQGRTDSMIFILNRVDQRGADDKPLDERLQQLKMEIQEHLNLPSLPDIIPFNARLLYYAQCAWGTNLLHTSSNVTPEVRLQLLKSLFKDCANFIEEKIDVNFNNFSIKFWTISSVKYLADLILACQFYYDLDDWLSDIKKSVKRNGKIDDETMQQLSIYTINWSGGEALWECIRLRLKESFSSVVIVPILKPVFDNLDSLISQVSILTEIRQLQDKKKIKSAKTNLAKIRDSIKINVENLEKSNREITNSFLEIIKNPQLQS